MTTSVAVIGSGIAGLSAAYLLQQKCAVTLFEKAPRLGGHTATVDVEWQGKTYAVDTGFIVYNDWTYPQFIQLMNTLGVASQATSMGFSVSSPGEDFEYAGNSINTLFAQRRRLFSPMFWRMLRDIVRFNRQAKADLQSLRISKDMTLGEYLRLNHYSDAFAHYYLVPMGAAIWSASLATMKQFPVLFFVRFFHNHGLLNLQQRPQWRVIRGGSRSYIAPLTAKFSEHILLNADIRAVSRSASGARLLFANGDERRFDQVVFACHSDEALNLLADASEAERDILAAIPYSENEVILHWDERLLPRNKRAWSSWNYRLTGDSSALPVVTYNMNILQGIDAPITFCVSLNAEGLIDPQKILGRFRYAHPQFSLAAMQAQSRWSEINGVNNTWYCGAYWANGFHEDGVVSAQRVAEQFGAFL